MGNIKAGSRVRRCHAAAVLHRVYANANRLNLDLYIAKPDNSIIIKYLTMRIILVSFLVYLFFAYSVASEVLPHEAEL